MRSALELGFCIAGIYACFLTWGVVQEKLASVDYTIGYSGAALEYWNPSDMLTSLLSLSSWFYTQIMITFHHAFVYFVTLFYVPSSAALSAASPKFESFVFLNMVQSIGSMVISFCMLSLFNDSFPLLSIRDIQTFLEANLPTFFPKSLNRKKRVYSVALRAPGPRSNYLTVPTGTSANRPARRVSSGPAMSVYLFLQYLRLSICFCFASPFGYASLKYIDYVAMNLGKSCKLLPLVLISIFVRGKSIERSKLISLLLITAGVTGFMLFDGKSTRTSSSSNESSWSSSAYGMFLLLINLTLDGAMNTFQDEIFSQYRITSFHMMFHMNWLSVALMLVYLVSPLTGEFWRTLDSLLAYPRLFGDVVLFGLCGALGQAFVFYTIEKFGALSLVTVTVTRKLFTILLSVAYFGHHLNIMQWVSVSVVFAALLLETASKHKKRIVPRSLLPDIPDSDPGSSGSPLSSGSASDSSFSSFDLEAHKKSI